MSPRLAAWPMIVSAGVSPTCRVAGTLLKSTAPCQLSMAPVLVLFMNEFMYLVTHGCCSDCEDLIEPHHDRFTALHPKLFADVLGVVRVRFRLGCLVGKNVSQ